MLLAFKRGKSAISRAIEYGTHSPYSHVELIFADNKAFSARAERKPAVAIIDFTPGDDEWDIERVEGANETAARTWAEKHCGEAYNWADIEHFVIPAIVPGDGKLICSASCVAALKAGGIFDFATPCDISPGALYLMAAARNDAQA